MTHAFDPLDPKQSFPELERGMQALWKAQGTFKRSLEQRRHASSYSFFDGPPFATGLPHYGHLLAGTIKDVIPRYQTMRGHHVERRFGWDCHGLPIEALIEKEHGIKDKRGIEAMGVATFNGHCRAAVQRYAREWRTVVERTGRWVDMDHDYRTMDPEYMEGVWWVLSQVQAKGCLYEGFRPMHICPRCATALSNFEVGQGYHDRDDACVTFTLPLVDDPKTVLLAWTTTPWSLPGNLWLAVDPTFSYAKVREGDVTYICAEALVAHLFKDREVTVLGTVTGRELLGLRYQPLFPHYADAEIPGKSGATYRDHCFKVLHNDALEVSETDGTGIVHLTSSTGEDSDAVARAEGVPPLLHVSLDGRFDPVLTELQGLVVKPSEGDPMGTDKVIIGWLKERGRVFNSGTIRHSYPHCWRCDTPLLPYTTSSWFIAVEKVKERLLQNAATISWMPAHLKEGRFGKWLENARDWSISRNRYWGTPLPVWKDEGTGQAELVASRDELIAKQPIRFTKVTLLRHAESEGNVQGIFQGTLPGTNLTNLGQQQAKDAAAFLASQRVDVIYCSPFARTRQTAEAIAAATGAQVIIDERLREVEMGPFEGRRVEESLREWHAQRSADDAAAIAFPTYRPGIETLASIQARLTDFLSTTLPRHRGEHVTIVTHGDPLLCARHHLTGQPHEKLITIRPDKASPEAHYWDHDRDGPLDLHKDVVDAITWPGAHSDKSVQATFVRHGHTGWDPAQGGSERDIGLSDEGREQVRQLAERLKAQTFDVIVTSDTKRAAETAEILSQALGLTIAEARADLRERDKQAWDARPSDDVRRELGTPDIALTFHYATPPGGESLSNFLRRISGALQHLRETYASKRVLVVGHGGLLRAVRALELGQSYAQAAARSTTPFAATVEAELRPRFRRVTDVLDCWVESGSMPYAQQQFPGRYRSSQDHHGQTVPRGFPADFIAEGVDQTRCWFYVLHVLGTILFDRAPYRNVVVNGIVLAEDGQKMSKKLKNYPDPMKVVETYGADALRFTLMSSPAVRAEDLRFSEKAVAENLRAVLLPLWNSAGFFVTYANEAGFTPIDDRRRSDHPLDRWMLAEVQDLALRMTKQLDAYDLSACCSELHATIDALTNWYIRLSRRRFAGKGDQGEPLADGLEAQHDALHTLHEVLVTLCQLLAPICPFLTDALFLNLTRQTRDSVHLSDWPIFPALTAEQEGLLARTRLTRSIVSLGLKLRSEVKVRVRQPLQLVTVALPPKLLAQLTADDKTLIAQELNVKDVHLSDDPGSLGRAIAQVNARKVGPRLGGRVQEIIAAGKRGDFTIEPDGMLLILDERLAPDEVTIAYQAAEGQQVVADGGIVVSLDTRLTPALVEEGLMRDLIRAVQQLRKDAGLSVADEIDLQVTGAEALLAHAADTLCRETNARLQTVVAEAHTVELEDVHVTIRFQKRT
jgi:isoleucyl-tRNA synthetase